MTRPDTITIRQPDDWHVHLRDGAMLREVVPFTAHQFARAIVMPNLAPPVTTSQMAREYHGRIMAALPEGSSFQPLMTIYLTDQTDPEDVAAGFEDGSVTACKLYPANATTNSARGVTDIHAIGPVLARMEQIGMPLLVHGESTSPEIDVFDREAVFIEQVLTPTLRRYPALKLVFEHITTAEAVGFVDAAPANVAATITPHHLQLNRNAMFAGGIRPHAFCLPVIKREKHRLALRRAAVSGSAKYFLGTDSAPHLAHTKETACGCAGIFNAPCAMESYAAVFDEENALDRLEGFASLHGPLFYGLPVNESHVTLTRQETEMPDSMTLSGGEVVPYHGGARIGWRFSRTPPG